MFKFIIKFYLLFIITISLMFFCLIAFQKHSEKRIVPPQPKMDVPIHFGQPPRPHYPSTKQNNSPPIAIPLLFIVGISSVFILCFLRHIANSYVVPLNLIQENLKKIKNNNLEIEFKHNSESPTIKDTFNTLDDMVEGLKEKENLQRKYIQTIAHDLRAPIIAQERAISILQEEFNNHELLEGMLANNEFYLKMINLILEAYNENKIKIDKTNVDITKTVKQLLKELKPSADRKNIAIKNNLPPSFNLYVDFVSINRIIMNLVSNSIDNIATNKTITISGAKNKDKTLIMIEDNGQGIEKEALEHIFEKYSSYNKSKKKLVSGLGLYIVKDLVLQNGGEIKVESEVGEYTSFKIEFPNKREL